MDLLLWRHAEAEDGSPDAKRKLTARGEKQAAQMGEWLRKNAPRKLRVLASPALRCQQTARALGVAFETDASLGTGGNVSTLLAAIGWPDGSGAKASQNIASNFGHVVVAAASNQTANFNSGGSAINKALGSNSYAVQNISSNDACAEDPCPGGNCAPTKPGKPGGKW